MILINVSFANSVGLLIAYNITHYAQTETTGKSVQYNMSSANSALHLILAGNSICNSVEQPNCAKCLLIEIFVKNKNINNKLHASYFVYSIEASEQ